MNLIDENTVQTLMETKIFVNEYILDGIYNNFLKKLHDVFGEFRDLGIEWI